MRSQWSSIVLVFATACSFQASCGGKKLNMDNAKKFVAETFEKETGVKPIATCPASVPIEKGSKFECTAKWGTTEAKVVIVQNDDQGNVTIESAKGILVAKRLETQVAEGIGKQLNLHVEVDCGERVRPAVPGATFQCDAKDANGQGGKVNIKVKDTDGNVDWEVAKS